MAVIVTDAQGRSVKIAGKGLPGPAGPQGEPGPAGTSPENAAKIAAGYYIGTGASNTISLGFRPVLYAVVGASSVGGWHMTSAYGISTNDIIFKGKINDSGVASFQGGLFSLTNDSLVVLSDDLVVSGQNYYYVVIG